MKNATISVHTRTRFLMLLVLLFAGSLSLLQSACDFDGSGVAPACERSLCMGEIIKFGMINPVPAAQPSFAINSTAGWSWVPFQISNQQLPLLYKNSNLVGKEIPSLVKGSFLLQSDANFGTTTLADNFIVIPTSQMQLESVFVAFDTRATIVPEWLSRKFQQVPQTTITTATSDQTGTGKFVTYSLWEAKNIAQMQQNIVVGGNNASPVQWINNKVGNQYLLFVRLQPIVDYTNRSVLEKVPVEVCITNDADPQEVLEASEQGGTAALFTWLHRPENQNYIQHYKDGLLSIEVYGGSCGMIRHTFSGLTVDKTCVQTQEDAAFPVSSWILRSRGTIDPMLSTASMVYENVPSSMPIAGTIHFDIDMMNNIVINELSLFGKEAVLHNGRVISELSFGQDEELIANCNDLYPPGPSRLCSQYVIPMGTMKVSGAAKTEGHLLTVELVNNQDVFCIVDFNSMSVFLQGGPLLGSIDVGDEIIDIELSLDITAFFDNLAPKASIQETNTYWECADNNMAQVTLSAHASFDQLNSSDIASFTWIEDAGLPSEQVLGQGIVLTLLMVYGNHDMTLEVVDYEGIPDRISFTLEVGDSHIDDASFPPDVYTLQQRRNGSFVTLGTGTGSDSCSGAVTFTNDAPANSFFPPGLSYVTWIADDERGNTRTHTQKVFVLSSHYWPMYSLSVLSAPQRSLGDAISLEVEFSETAMSASTDMYVIFHSPDGLLASIGRGGEIRLEEYIPFIERFSVNDYESIIPILENSLSDYFSHVGFYSFQVIVTKAGGDPRNRGDIVNLIDSSFEIVD